MSKLDEVMSLIEKAVKEEIKSVLMIDGVKFIYGKGHTPSFNDGDPCTHIQCLDVNQDCDLELDTEEINEKFGTNFEENIPQVQGHLHKQAWNILKQKYMSSFMNLVFDTDWEMLFWLDDNGEVVYKRIDYYDEY